MSSCNIIGVDAYNIMSCDQKKLFYENITKNKFNKTLDKKFQNSIRPNWLPALYCNNYFPNFNTTQISIKLESDDIMNGVLLVKDPATFATTIYLQWFGYASQLYDGQLFLTVVKQDARIVGIVNGSKIAFMADNLLRPFWPGFLVIAS